MNSCLLMHNIRSSFGIPGDVSSVKSFPYLSHPLYKDVKDVKFKDCSNKMIGIGNFSLMFWKEFVNPQSCVFVFFAFGLSDVSSGHPQTFETSFSTQATKKLLFPSSLMKEFSFLFVLISPTSYYWYS